MKTSLGSLSLALLFVAACGSEEAAPIEPAAPEPDETAGCDRGTLEADIGWATPLAGPAVDPATGALAPPPAEGYVVSSTYLRLRPEPEAQMRLGQLMGPIQEALAAQPGLLAIQLGASNGCSTARTFTVWASEEAMYGFVAGPAHAAAMQAVGEVSRGGSLVTHWTATTLEEASWTEATKQLAAKDGPTY